MLRGRQSSMVIMRAVQRHKARSSRRNADSAGECAPPGIEFHDGSGMQAVVDMRRKMPKIEGELTLLKRGVSLFNNKEVEQRAWFELDPAVAVLRYWTPPETRLQSPAKYSFQLENLQMMDTNESHLRIFLGFKGSLNIVQLRADSAAEFNQWTNAFLAYSTDAGAAAGWLSSAQKKAASSQGSAKSPTRSPRPSPRCSGEEKRKSWMSSTTADSSPSCRNQSLQGSHGTACCKSTEEARSSSHESAGSDLGGRSTKRNSLESVVMQALLKKKAQLAAEDLITNSMTIPAVDGEEDVAIDSVRRTQLHRGSANLRLP